MGDFQVRSDIAIRRHQVLVNCAFSFCWAARFAHPPPPAATPPVPEADGEKRTRSGRPAAVLAPGDPAVRARLAPWITLQRWWAARSNAPPPPQLQP